MKLIMRLLLSVCLMALAGNGFAAFNNISGYLVETNYANPHAEESLVSFDWDENTNLYYTTGSPYWDMGFSVYMFDGAAVTTIYTNAGAFAGSRVAVIGGHVYFNDGGTYERWTYDYFRYDPADAFAPTNMGITSDLWGLETRDGSDIWTSGGMSASIYYSSIDADGNWESNPLVNLGGIGNASGPLTFDAAGNLFYAEGYNVDGPVVYRWSAAEVAAALANPAGAPLNPTGHVWATLSSGDGATGMAADSDGNLLVTATSFSAPSELHRLLAINGNCFGYEVLVRSDERLETLRMRSGEIHVSSAAGIFTVSPERTLRMAVQAGSGGAVMVIGLNEQGHSLRLSTIAEESGQWIARSIDGNRLLAQAGDGGAIAVAELDADNGITNFAVLAESAPGWIARALDGNRILAQAGDGGMVGIQNFGAGYTLGDFTVVLSSAPGWIARDLDDKQLLAQAGDGGAIIVAQLDDSGALVGTATVCESIPGWIARSLSGNLLMAQDGADGMSVIMELDSDKLPAYYRLMLNPVEGVSLLGLDME